MKPATLKQRRARKLNYAIFSMNTITGIVKYVENDIGVTLSSLMTEAIKAREFIRKKHNDNR